MESVAILKELIRKKSVTPCEAGIYDLVQECLPSFVHERMDCEGVKNLYSYREMGHGGVHLCFAGHVDVVKEGVGWSVDPYGSVCENGYIYGRGAQDMKSGVAAFVASLADESVFEGFNGKISVILTSDEEGDAIHGTQAVLKILQQRGELPHYAIVAEPTATKWVGDTIKIGRRGSINGVLIIKGVQGHVAYPQKCDNPVERIAPVLANIAGHDLDSGDDFFEPSKIVITDIRGGLESVNVTPSELKIMFNVRNSTQTNQQTLEKYLQKVLDGIPYELKLTTSSRAFLTKRDSKIIHKLVKVLSEYFKNPPLLSTSGGTSDAKYFAAFGVEVVECGVCNDRIHAIDERVHEDEVRQLQDIFTKLILHFGEES